MRVHINIGSNLGNRREYIQQAVVHLRRLALLNPNANFRQSSIVESEPWGYSSPYTYLNIGVSFDTDIDALELLHSMQAIEQALGSQSHRKADGTYADRVVDIDIIAYGHTVVDTPELTLPHPRSELRDFVMIPLREIDPDLADFVEEFARQNHCDNRTR
ncbi:MAG: 2-amino-4-hydroxy-6-hydroxymethyldihydropteridine diphosphokinase [Muribaculaceae bacterium]|nr:2-amino-4-hydroxy-6-hydroxymethyldihydropteridine diphosphokinase [Muribaculaceae bacterium]